MGSAMRCWAGICGDGGASRRAAAAARASASMSTVAKPVLRLDEPYESPGASASFQELVDSFGLVPAPPGLAEPRALVTSNFQKNSSRLLVVLPSSDASWAIWDDSLGQPHACVAPLFRWAAAGNFAVALFSASALQAAPAETWDSVLKGSPARFVAVAAAGGALKLLQDALTPVHPLLYGRLRCVCSPWTCNGTSDLKAPSGEDGEELFKHLQGTLVQLPASWADLEPYGMHQCLFQLVAASEERFQKGEMLKFSGFQNLKENDVPGLRRMPMDTRIKRMDRDRDNDELARLLRKHEREAGAAGPAAAAPVDEEEPGVD